MGKKRCLHFFSAVLDRILFILQCNDNIYESLDEFEIRLDPTTGFYGNRYVYNGKISVSIFSRLFFICSFPHLQVAMTCIRTRRSSKFG